MQIMHIWSILDAHIYMLVHFLAYICKIACCIFKYVPIFAYLRIWIADDCRWLHISVGSNPAGPVAGCSCSIPASPAVTESRIFSASPIIWLSALSGPLKQDSHWPVRAGPTTLQGGACWSFQAWPACSREGQHLSCCCPAKVCLAQNWARKIMLRLRDLPLF